MSELPFPALLPLWPPFGGSGTFEFEVDGALDFGDLEFGFSGADSPNYGLSYLYELYRLLD